MLMQVALGVMSVACMSVIAVLVLVQKLLPARAAIDPIWLSSNDPALPMVNFAGRPYAYADYEAAQDKELKPLRPYRDESEMEVCVAYRLLRRVLRAARKRNEVPQFQKRLERFIRGELANYGELRDEVHQKLRVERALCRNRTLLSEDLSVSSR